MQPSDANRQEGHGLPAKSHGAGEESSKPSSSKVKKRPKQQPRQHLSCSKCRERKVKCDRTKPCSACCARGHPKECQFSLTEGSTFGPVQQSLELRKLRAENQKLKERLLEGRTAATPGNESMPTTTSAAGLSLKTAQRRFGLDEARESIYFGNPSVATVIADINTATSSRTTACFTHPLKSINSILTHHVPSVYPFPTMWTTNNWIQGLHDCIKSRRDVLHLISTYSTREDSIYTPRLSSGVGKQEVEVFIASFDQNATSYPDVLALIFAKLATEVQRSKHEKQDEEMEVDQEAGDMNGAMFLTASMQALRQSSFASQPTLRNVQAMTMITTCLANSGRVLDAWTFLGTTIRNAQAIGLHRNPTLIDPLPSMKESASRKKLWWYLLFIDQQFSMTLGRPMGISAIGDCPFAQSLTTDTAFLRVTECVDQVAILGRQIMGASPLVNPRLNGYQEKLQMLLDTLPEGTQFQTTWLTDPSHSPDSPLDEYSAAISCNVHSYLIILNSQRLDQGSATPANSFARNSTNASQSTTEAPFASIQSANTEIWTSLVASSRIILDVLQYLHTYRSSALVDWTLKHQAFTATGILLTDATMRSKMDSEEYIETAVAIFQDLAEHNHDEMSRRAYSKLSEDFQQVRRAASRRGSNATSASFQEYGIGSQSMRRDSQISTPALQQSFTSSQAEEYKAVDDMDSDIGNSHVYAVQQSSNYQQRFQPQQATPTQQRRATLPYGPNQVAQRSELAPSAMQGMPTHTALFSTPITPAPVSNRRSMHAGALPPQLHMAQALGHPSSYVPQGIVPHPMPFSMPPPSISQYLHAPRMQAQPLPQQSESSRPPQQYQYQTHQPTYPPQQPSQLSQGYYQPISNSSRHSEAFSSQPEDQHPAWQ